MIYVVETLYNICLNQSIDQSPSPDFEKKVIPPVELSQKKDPKNKISFLVKAFAPRSHRFVNMKPRTDRSEVLDGSRQDRLVESSHKQIASSGVLRLLRRMNGT